MTGGLPVEAKRVVDENCVLGTSVVPAGVDDVSDGAMVVGEGDGDTDMVDVVTGGSGDDVVVGTGSSVGAAAVGIDVTGAKVEVMAVAGAEELGAEDGAEDGADDGADVDGTSVADAVGFGVTGVTDVGDDVAGAELGRAVGTEVVGPPVGAADGADCVGVAVSSCGVEVVAIDGDDVVPG